MTWTRKTNSYPAGAIKGVAVSPDGRACISCGTDCQVRLWPLPHAPFLQGPVEAEDVAPSTFQGKFAFRSVDHHWSRNHFATAGAQVRRL